MDTEKIENRIAKKGLEIKASIEITKKEIDVTHEKISKLKNEQVKIFQKIATIYLLESPKNEDSQIQTAIKNLQELNSNLKRKSDKLDILINDYQQKIDNILIRLDDFYKLKLVRLDNDSEYISLLNRYNVSKEKLNLDKKKIETSNQQFSTKIEKYNQNRYYNYLIDRDYGEISYKGSGIIRNLDNWIARFINFSENYNNHKILIALVEESKICYESEKNLCLSLLEQKDQKEYDVEKNLKLPKLKLELKQTEEYLAYYKKQKQDIENELIETRSGESNEFRKISNRLAKMLQSQSQQRLHDITLQTRSTEDDILLEKIAELDQKINQFEISFESIQQKITILEKTYNRFEQTLYLFKKNNIPKLYYDYQISSYDLDELLNNIYDEDIFPESIIHALISCRILK
ncbi:hypothetical protein GFU95_08225 [Apibacter sp. B3889]|uniref:hypothetical protein n=1 Tax=unclassified Apibacter TaxID=2630820 RepID=UPI0013276CD7|nr:MULTISPECIES: hypothetical protein [unclassified Apibacter]MXO34999.1 hypothetical protein [Apibacter sp. B3883]MXO42357.1 hypothetical protein [Apibacter sp. B3889]MXP04374.1 hypothetical protein [Apibacter sp. B3887]MXP08445.1 hypothetical protein [Apibacter sp. B3935]